jgi:hypothetical protein
MATFTLRFARLPRLGLVFEPQVQRRQTGGRVAQRLGSRSGSQNDAVHSLGSVGRAVKASACCGLGLGLAGFFALDVFIIEEGPVSAFFFARSGDAARHR